MYERLAEEAISLSLDAPIFKAYAEAYAKAVEQTLSSVAPTGRFISLKDLDNWIYGLLNTQSSPDIVLDRLLLELAEGCIA